MVAPSNGDVSFLASLSIVSCAVLEDTTLAQAVRTIIFSGGESLLSLPVGIVNDAVHEGLEEFNVQFTVVNGDMVEADPTRQSALVSISDEEDSKDTGVGESNCCHCSQYYSPCFRSSHGPVYQSIIHSQRGR